PHPQRRRTHSPTVPLQPADGLAASALRNKMIPIRLSLRNFMCYRDNTEVLDLTGIHLACLSGENGAGKSALLEAITWALWGKARDRFIDDELISKGATEMEVDFQFMLNGDAYRVIRKRAMKGKVGTTVLEIQI